MGDLSGQNEWSKYGRDCIAEHTAGGWTTWGSILLSGQLEICLGLTDSLQIFEGAIELVEE